MSHVAHLCRLERGPEPLHKRVCKKPGPLRLLLETYPSSSGGGVVEVTQPRSLAFSTNFGLGPSGRLSVCLAIAFMSPLHPVPALGAAKAGKATDTIMAAITTATVSTKR